MPLIAISAKDIDAAGRALSEPLPKAWVDEALGDADATAREEGRIEARLSRSGADSIVVRGHVEARVTVPCARCLQPASLDLASELSLLLHAAPTQPMRRPRAAEPALDQPSEARASKKSRLRSSEKASAASTKKATKKDKEPEYEFSAEEAEHDTYDGETVVLDEFAREALLLELPIFPLCSEACPGIAAGSAPTAKAKVAEVAVDPRLAPLGALREKLARSSGGQRSAPPPSPAKKPSKSPKKSSKK